jgi:hypothetical protein
LAEQLKWYATAAYHFSGLWKDETNLGIFLTNQLIVVLSTVFEIPLRLDSTILFIGVEF